MDQQEIHYWETVGSEWIRTRPDSLWRDYCDAVHSRWLDRWLPQSRSTAILKTDLFDEAIGGGLHRILEARARVVVGVDLSWSVAQAAHASNPGIAAVCADVRRLPFADNAFDVVVSNSTLDHFHTPDEFRASLHEIHRILEPGGRLLLTMDNPVNPAVGLRNALPISFLNRIRLVPYYVGITYGPRRLRALLEQAGFQVIQTRAVMHCLRILAVPVSRVLQQIAGETVQRAWLKALLGCEGLARLPSRFLTGNFVAVLASKKTFR
jgi:SAM-dependent methyltransferase